MDSVGHVYIVDQREAVVRKLTPQYQLAASANPPAAGTVTAGGYFDKGTNVNVQASANPGFVFAGFTSDDRLKREPRYSGHETRRRI